MRILLVATDTLCPQTPVQVTVFENTHRLATEFSTSLSYPGLTTKVGRATSLGHFFSLAAFMQRLKSAT